MFNERVVLCCVFASSLKSNQIRLCRTKRELGFIPQDLLASVFLGMVAARFSLVALVVLAAAVSFSHASYGEECPWGCNDHNTLLGNPVCRCKQTETCLADATWNGHEVGKCIPNGTRRLIH